MISPAPGAGGLPRIALVAADGARAEVYLHGAHVTSWVPAGTDDDRLFVSALSRFAPGEPICGGIPVCFPQFATQGPLPSHGFARVTEWALLAAERTGDGAARAVLRLGDSPTTRALWPHAFTTELTVTVAGQTLAVALAVANGGAAPFDFTGALHTYLRVDDVGRAVVRGLAGARYRDKVLGADGVLETAAELRIDGEIDRVYHAAPADLGVHEPARTTTIRATGFPDTVVWHPGTKRAAALDDLGPGGHRHMLCVEAAVARAPVTVNPGERWVGTQRLGASPGSR